MRQGSGLVAHLTRSARNRTPLVAVQGRLPRDRPGTVRCAGIGNALQYRWTGTRLDGLFSRNRSRRGGDDRYAHGVGIGRFRRGSRNAAEPSRRSQDAGLIRDSRRTCYLCPRSRCRCGGLPRKGVASSRKTRRCAVRQDRGLRSLLDLLISGNGARRGCDDRDANYVRGSLFGCGTGNGTTEIGRRAQRSGLVGLRARSSRNIAPRTGGSGGRLPHDRIEPGRRAGSDDAFEPGRLRRGFDGLVSGDRSRSERNLRIADFDEHLVGIGFFSDEAFRVIDRPPVIRRARHYSRIVILGSRSRNRRPKSGKVIVLPAIFPRESIRYVAVRQHAVFDPLSLGVRIDGLVTSNGSRIGEHALCAAYVSRPMAARQKQEKQIRNNYLFHNSNDRIPAPPFPSCPGGIP